MRKRYFPAASKRSNYTKILYPPPPPKKKNKKKTAKKKQTHKHCLCQLELKIILCLMILNNSTETNLISKSSFVIVKGNP